MINYRMTQDEILSEFWHDYYDVIRPRCFRIVEREKKGLIALQKKRPGEWLRMKKTVEIKSRGNLYEIILWVTYAQKSTAIKTCCWCSYMDGDGKRRILLLPSEEKAKAVIIFTSGFMREWKEQIIGQQEKDGRDVEREFFIWVEGNYVVYHNEEDRSKIEVDLNNLGAGIGTFKEPGSYMFKHFLGDVEIEKLQKEVGNILDPLELWNAAHRPKEVVINPEEFYDPEKELNDIFDEIAEKYG